MKELRLAPALLRIEKSGGRVASGCEPTCSCRCNSAAAAAASAAMTASVYRTIATTRHARPAIR